LTIRKRPSTHSRLNKTICIPCRAQFGDGQPEARQIRIEAAGRWFKSLSAWSGIGYGVVWVAGLVAWPSNLAVDASKSEIVSLYAAHMSQAAAQYLLVEGLAGVLLGIVLFSCLHHVGRRGRAWTSLAEVVGGIVVTVSLLQCLLGLFLVSSSSKGYLALSADIYQLINRLDGVKQLLLGACVVLLGILLRRASNYPRWLGRTTVFVGVALAPSGLANLLLWSVLASAAFVSLPLLIVWIAGNGVWLGTQSRKGAPGG
jgi:hypothetical protein